MPYINISLFEGQSGEKKAAVAEKITDVIKQELGVPDDKIWITYTDIAKTDWFIQAKSCE